MQPRVLLAEVKDVRQRLINELRKSRLELVVRADEAEANLLDERKRIKLRILEQLKDLDGGLRVSKLLADLVLQLIHEPLAVVGIQLEQVPLDLQKAALLDLLIHVNEVKLSLAPLVEVWQLQEPLEEVRVLLAADALLLHAYA